MGTNENEFRLPAIIGAVIHAERSARKLTQQQLAQMAGLHPMALSKLERGVQHDVGIETLRQIASALSSVCNQITVSGLVSIAEQWHRRLQNEWQTGRLAVTPSTLTGASIAALVSLLPNDERRTR
jgi:transcriptional regulator with XRE-family HTH domain